MIFVAITNSFPLAVEHFFEIESINASLTGQKVLLEYEVYQHCLICRSQNLRDI